MLHGLSANDHRFRPLSFARGLNIIAASRTQQRTGKISREEQFRTRNGAGKTSFVHLVHFVLGGDADGPLKSESLNDWEFALDFDVGFSRITASRSVTNKKQINLRGDLARLQIGSDAEAVYKISPWTKLLGTNWFRLDDGPSSPGSPTFRSLFPYFARWEETGGFLDATRYVKAQRQSTVDTNLAFLFGFDFELVRRLYRIKDSRDKLSKARSAIRDLEKERTSGAGKSDMEALLRAELSAAALSRDKLKTDVTAFRVLPAFRELERELAEINHRDRELSNGDVIDRELILANEQALEGELLPQKPELERLFAEAKIVFPELVRKRYSEVQGFHEAMVANRRSYLLAEHSAATKRIEERKLTREQFEFRRSAILREISSGGAADDLLRLRQELSNHEARVREIEVRLTEARRIEEQDEKLKSDFDEAARGLRADWRERAKISDEASRLFATISAELYGTSGTLEISAGENGLRFVPHIPRDAARGVNNMSIFCFDMALAVMCARRGIGPGFVIHDSHLFESTDGRQFARALKVGEAALAEYDWQYIVTANTDQLDRAQREGGEEFGAQIIQPKLSDAPGGGLFGFEFN